MRSRVGGRHAIVRRGRRLSSAEEPARAPLAACAASASGSATAVACAQLAIAGAASSVRTAGRSAAASARRRPRPIGPRGPAPARRSTVSRPRSSTSAVEQPAEAFGVGGEVAVLLQQQLQPRGLVAARRACTAPCSRMLLDQRLGHAQRADLAALAFDEHRPRRVEAASAPASSSVSKRFWLGCGACRARAPSTEPRWPARPSRSSICAPCAASACSSRRLAAAGAAAQHVVAEALRQRLQLGRAPARERPCSRLAAARVRKPIWPRNQASEPERWPPRQQYTSGCHSRGLSAHPALEVVGDVARHHRRADLARLAAARPACTACRRCAAARRRAPAS